MRNPFISAITKRRTQYSLGSKLPISRSEVTTLIKDAVKQAPSAFNSQSSRIVILHGAKHADFWDIVRTELSKIVPEKSFGPTEKKLQSFAAGAGTILFYEDQDVVKKLQSDFPLYAENFPAWSEHSTGIAQFAVWSALANSDIGASLQHYNPLPDAAAAEKFDVPASWKLRAQMPFGSNEAPFPSKTYMDDAVRFKVLE